MEESMVYLIIYNQNESTKVQNPRCMCGLASDGIIAHDDSEVQLYNTCSATCIAKP